MASAGLPGYHAAHRRMSKPNLASPPKLASLAPLCVTDEFLYKMHGGKWGAMLPLCP